MTHFYRLIIITILFTSFSYAQGYQFGIVNNSGFNFSIVAIPDFDSTGNTDISDIGFSLMLPAGTSDVTAATAFNGRSWGMTEVNASQLTAFGGDGTEDAFIMNLPPGQTLLPHTSGQQIVLVSFDVSNMPASGEMRLLLNTDPIATALGGAANSFYNTDLDGAGGMPTDDFFSGLAPGLDSFMFATLGVDEQLLTNTSISVYPNPTSKYINITSNLQIDSVELFDLLGKRVLTTNETNKIRIDQFPAGVYLVKIYAEQSSITKKIIIE